MSPEPRIAVVGSTTVGEGVAAIHSRRSQGAEGVLVATTGPLYQLGLHHPLRMRATRLVASPSMEPADA